MLTANRYAWVMQEEAQQEILDLWGELLLPMPYVSDALFLGEVNRRISEMNLQEDWTPSTLDPGAALEVVETYLF